MKKDFSISKAILIGAGVGAATGFLTGILTHRTYLTHKTLKPTDILASVKQAFDAKDNYQVEGSWIEYDKIPWKEYAVETSVYRGGVTCKKEDHFVQYEFIADAYTGTIIDIYERTI